MTMDEKLDLILNRVEGLDQRMNRMEQDMAQVKQETESVKLLLENEIRVNIQRVAEGHLDLSRNLHEAMKPSNEVEMLSIKVRQLESDMRELKMKLAM